MCLLANHVGQQRLHSQSELAKVLLPSRLLYVSGIDWHISVCEEYGRPRGIRICCGESTRMEWTRESKRRRERRMLPHAVAEGCRYPRCGFQRCKFAWTIVGSWIPSVGIFDTAGGRGRWETTRWDETSRRRGREKETLRGIGCGYSASLTLRTHVHRTHPCAVPRVSTRHGWMHRMGAPLHLRVAGTALRMHDV